ncbi:MAG: hypothetical protein ACKE5M_03145 [Methylophilaceae bacterium]
MSLQDEHLQQALKNAPDRDLAPSDAARKHILDYAQEAGQPRRVNIFKRCWNMLSAWRITSWQIVGMSTVASVMLVTVMLRQQLPQKSIWESSNEQEIAQVEELESANTNMPKQEELAMPSKASKEQTFSQSVDSGLEKRFEDSEAIKSGGSISNKAKNSVTVETKSVKKRKDKIEKPALDLSDKDDAVIAAPAPAPAPAPAESRATSIAVVEADAVESAIESNDGKVAGATGRMESSDAASKPSLAARKQNLPAGESVSGKALAKQDIQAGNLRILFAGEVWPEDKPLVDEETGFRIELTKNAPIQMLENEVEAYNQTMRDWYHANNDLSH